VTLWCRKHRLRIGAEITAGAAATTTAATAASSLILLAEDQHCRIAAASPNYRTASSRCRRL